MAILNNQALTLADWRTATGENGAISDMINMLSQTNEILDDLLWVEANQGMSHKSTILTGLPAAYFRAYNEGVPRAKSTRVPITDTCAQLEVYSEVDKALADLNGNAAAWRLSEDSTFVDGISQQMASTLFYGNSATAPKSFMGLASRFSTVQTAVANSAANVIDGGGTGSTNTSVWLCCWGPGSGHGIYPKGSMAGLNVQDVTTGAPISDANGNLYQAYRTHFKWDCGLTIRDWRYFVRIPNIDVSLLSGGSAANLASLMTVAINKIPVMPRSAGAVQAATKPAGIGPAVMSAVFYVNRTVRTALQNQARTTSNVLLRQEQWDGMPVLSFLGVPIKTADALLNNEGRVT